MSYPEEPGVLRIVRGHDVLLVQVGELVEALAQMTDWRAALHTAQLLLCCCCHRRGHLYALAPWPLIYDLG